MAEGARVPSELPSDLLKERRALDGEEFTKKGQEKNIHGVGTSGPRMREKKFVNEESGRCYDFLIVRERTSGAASLEQKNKAGLHKTHTRPP